VDEFKLGVNYLLGMNYSSETDTQQFFCLRRPCLNHALINTSAARFFRDLDMPERIQVPPTPTKLLQQHILAIRKVQGYDNNPVMLSHREKQR